MSEIKTYRLLIFDFDGTLVDTAPDIALYANRVLEEFGVKKRPLEEVKKAVGRGVHELLRDLGISSNEAALERAVASFKEQYWAAPVVHTKPYPGVREALSGPLNKMRKAILTNKPYGLTVKILKELNLENYFEVVIGLDMGHPAKPDPTSASLLMRQLEAKPSETLFIGDSSVDAETSRNAGVDFAWVDYGYDRVGEPYRPSLHFSSAQEWTSLNKGGV